MQVDLITGLEPGTGPFRILVVDDIQENCDLLRAILTPVGFELKEVAKGEEALAAFTEWLPHAILMDLRMPVMDGYEAAKRLKATETGRTVPILAVTASAFKDDEQVILSAGFDGYVRKPFIDASIENSYCVTRRPHRFSKPVRSY